MNKKKFLVLLAISCALATTAIALVSSREYRGALKATTSPPAALTPVSPQRVDDSGVTDHRVHRESLSSHLRGPFQTLGDRLEVRGKERITIAGTLRWAEEALATPFGLIWETPGRLRLEVMRGSQPQITTFDGSRVVRTGGDIDSRDYDLLETLLYDSAEHFFVSQMQGAATRTLGTRFRLIEDSRAEYSGPFHDIFEVTEQIGSRREAREQTRQYFFNSDTHLLEAVKYRVTNGELESQVESRFENWQQLNGQRFPSRIVRLENSTAVLILTLASITVSARIEDGVFTQTVNQQP